MRLFIFLVFNLILTIGYADVCPICLHEIISGQQSTSLCCGHDFHKDCIETLRSNHRDLLCPVCRQRSRVHHGASSGNHSVCFGQEPAVEALSRPELQANMIVELQNKPASPKLLSAAALFVQSQLHCPPRDDNDRRLYKTLLDLFFQRFSELSEADRWKSVEAFRMIMDITCKPETQTQTENQTETETRTETQTQTQTQTQTMTVTVTETVTEAEAEAEAETESETQ
ncbi:RING finger domain-containing protein [Endozoicomonas sp. ALC020]|uniref:RING finger domain-containing protein n=1 Tax=unclassified Endozoicomonas TaxID=2644528 RepID=UPI003BB111D2